jgi:hypothetical protein
MVLWFGLLVLLAQARPPVDQPNVAFEADYEVVVSNTADDGVRIESRAFYRLYQDARGRSRLEGSAIHEGKVLFRYALLTDLSKHRTALVDLESGKPMDACEVGSSLAAHSPIVPSAPSSDVTAESEEQSLVDDLGEKEIDGFLARGLRITSGPSITEVWNAVKIDQPPILVWTKGTARESSSRLFNIRLIEPDPRLFAPLDDPD